ncbi:MAG: AAA family ATPase [Thermoproteus sp.]
MSCAIPSWPVAKRDAKLAGRRWIQALEELAELASRYPLSALIGRAGMGKTQVLYALCERTDCIYIDATEFPERSLAYMAAVVAWRLAARSTARSKVVDVYRRYGFQGLLSLAQGDPSWTLSAALDLAPGRVVVALDEWMPSPEDPQFFQAASALHRIRNMGLDRAGFVVSFLPEVYEKLASKIPPLGNILTAVSVQLPDVLAEEDAEEIAAAYCPERTKAAVSLLRARPDITVRELLMAMSATKEVEIPIE